MGIFSFVKPGKKVFEIVKPKIAKRLTDKRKVQDDIIKTRDKTFSDYQIKDAAQKTELRAKANQPKINKKIADIYDKKAKGGRIGYKKGTPNPFARKTKLKKIQEAFKTTPSFMNVKKEKPKKRIMAKDGTKNKKATEFGMLSVKAGIDKDPNPTYADKIAGAKMKNKKKFV